MRSLLFLALVLSLAACSLFSGSDEKIFTTDYKVDLTTVIDSVGRPDSMVVWVTKNSKDADTLYFHSTALLGAAVVVPLESSRRDSVKVKYHLLRLGRAVAANEQNFVQGDSSIIPKAPLLSPSIELLPDNGPTVGTPWTPLIRIHNSTKQAYQVSIDFDGNGTWDLTSTRHEYMSKNYVSAGRVLVIARIFDELGLDNLDSMQVDVVP